MSGRIITFYSYKGGTGRTMALANMAWILASNKLRVLMIDWDLEAPGLHRYFHPFLKDKTLGSTKGMIDFVFDYQRMVLGLPESTSTLRFPDSWYDERIDVFPYITELDCQQADFGELHLLPAGQQGAEYGVRVNTFNWRQLYENLGGFQFFEAMKRQLVSDEYDYVLIDSRTGVSDTSGICTVQMPDSLVVCFTLNSQSIEGAGEVALSVLEQRGKHEQKGHVTLLQDSVAGDKGSATPAVRPVRIFPLPTRLERAEKLKLELARDAARMKFDTFLTGLSPADRDRYWGEVEIYYEPFYAYEEVLAVFADKPGPISSLLASIERLTARVTEGEVQKMQNLAAAKREEMLAAYNRQSKTAGHLAVQAAALLKRLTPSQQDTARDILLRLVSVGAGGTVFRTAVATDDFSPDDRAVLNRLVDDGLLDRKLAEDGATECIAIADGGLLEKWPTLRGWIQEHSEAVRFREILDARARRWDEVGRPADLLLSRSEVAAARSTLENAKSVTLRERLFVDGSAKRAQRLQWARNGAWVLLVGVVIGYLIQAYARPSIQRFLILRSAQTKIDPIDGQKYVWIKPGHFEMGCSYNASQSSCRSQRVVILSSFWMGQTEVTNQAYRRFLQARHPEQLDAFAARNLPVDYPVNNVTWPDAFEYCSWIGGRLPSDAEFEYAARAGLEGQRYITGDKFNPKEVNASGKPMSVASYPPNPWGLFDMSGNVAEWTDDVAGGWEGLYAFQESGPVKDPRHSATQLSYGPTYMVVRGGSYDSGNLKLSLDEREQQYFNTADPRVGFRCIVPASDLEKVASNYQSFSVLYGMYGHSYHFPYDPTNDWWNTIYLRYLNNAQSH